MKVAQIAALVCMLAATSIHAGEQSTLAGTLNKRGVNFITTDGILYLMDDNDPRKICEIVDRFPGSGVNEVYNVKTLVNADCRKHR